MAAPLLYISRLLPDPVMAAARQQFRLLNEPRDTAPADATLGAGIREADAAICTLTDRIDASMLAAASRLTILANYAVGYNNIDLHAAQRHGITVTNTPDVLTDATADLTWALILAAARRLPEGQTLVREGRWNGWTPTQLLGQTVTGRTLGIVGMGRIGHAVAQRAQGFRMPVLFAARSTVHPAIRLWPEAWRQVPLDELLQRADFVSLHVPLTPDTRHLIGARELALMRPTAVLVNTARGPVVDEAALVRAVQEGRLAGIGLDVYEHEPELHPALRRLPRVVTLPHLGSATLETRVRMGEICLENIAAVLAGRPAPNRVV